MTRNKIFRMGLITAVIAVFATSIGSKVEAECGLNPCDGDPWPIAGKVLLIGNPAPIGTIAKIVCTSGNCFPHTETCATNSAGGYGFVPEACDDLKDGYYDVSARYDNGSCIWDSQVENVYWDGVNLTTVPDLILDPPPGQGPNCY